MVFFFILCSATMRTFSESLFLIFAYGHIWHETKIQNG